MRVRKNTPLWNPKYLFGLISLPIIAVICLAFGMTGSDDFNLARKELLLRRIGHEILLRSGDSSSLVLPINKIARNEYQISFEKPFSFQPDSLVHLTRDLMAGDPHTQHYVVTVVNCSTGRTVYGYAISKNKKDDIISCLGRTQPKACYKINIQLKPAAIIKTKYMILGGTLLFVSLIGFSVLKRQKTGSTFPERQDTGMFSLGSLLFYPETRQLVINGKTTDLTRTETRVLKIFALSPNTLIERNRLQKEIWEDEGVIVGRSLDMFISKLRKKLQVDPALNITGIRGKGYKLEING